MTGCSRHDEPLRPNEWTATNTPETATYVKLGRSRHDELRALAERAQRVEPGPWRLEDDGGYIAAVSPDVLLALLDEVAAADGEAERAREAALEVADALAAERARADKATQALEQIADGRNAIALARAALADLARPESEPA